MAAKTASKKAAPAAPKKAAAKGAKKAPAKAAKPAPKASQDPVQAQEAHAREVERRLAKAEQMHQDPRGPAHQPNPAPNALGVDPRKDQGAIKNRAAPRMNKIVNWFRRGSKR